MNVNTLIVVADSSRARLFRIAKTDAPRAPFVLRETESLVHPEARIQEGDHRAVIALSTHPLQALPVDERERELPKEVRVRSEIGESSELSPSALLEELERRGALQE